MAARACHVIPATGRLNRAPRIVPRWPPGVDLVAVARGPPTWCLVPPGVDLVAAGRAPWIVFVCRYTNTRCRE